MTPYLIGLVIGVLIGSIPVHLPNGMTVKLGLAGGVFITSLLSVTVGGIGPLIMHVPAEQRETCRGNSADAFFWRAPERLPVPHCRCNSGARHEHAFCGNAHHTTFSVVVGIAVMHWGYRMNVLSIMGALVPA